ncbi:MAG: carbon-nitrogen hydrolase family protein [Hyphomicrobiales bacterium]|nr:carbon-nitrogen hydrolase family protein [Hyphomicrobiales bacterium]
MTVSNKFKVACLQMTTGTNIADNLSILSKRLKIAKDMGANLIITPEQTLLMAENKTQLFNQISNEKEDFGLKEIRKIIKHLGVFVIIGSLSIKYNNQLALNRSYAFDSMGEVIGFYDKIHMFDVKISDEESYFESNTYKPGEKLSIINLPWGMCGLSICYDLRFPNLYRQLAQKGAKFITVPSAFTITTGKAHWHTLLRARAIETGCYIFAPAQIGFHENGRKTYGHSLIVSPWGNIISEAKIGDQMAFAEIDTDEVELYRKKIPTINQNYDYL